MSHSNFGRPVTERDLRMPEFRDAALEDLEFRADGKLVRKDRWENAVQTIRSIVGINAREFEIDEVVARVRELASGQEWEEVGVEGEDWACPPADCDIWVKLSDGSQLANVRFHPETRSWAWALGAVDREQVIAWRMPDGAEA